MAEPKRVKFESSDEPLKRPTVVPRGQQKPQQPKHKALIPFEEFLNGKAPKSSKPLGQAIPKAPSKEPKPRSQGPTSQPQGKPHNGILKEKATTAPLETPDEKSLENIFDSRLLGEQRGSLADISPKHPPSEPHGHAPRDPLPLAKHHSMDAAKNQPAMTAQPESQLVRSNLQDENSPSLKPVRGLFKKELYGDDDTRKKEAQLKMKKELEMQMEENKLKKELEKKRKEDEDKMEQEKIQRYLEKEREKKQEEERKDNELKMKKEQFSQQQNALLEEYRQQNSRQKNSRVGRKNLPTPATTTHDSRPIQEEFIPQSNFQNTSTGHKNSHMQNSSANFGNQMPLTNPNESISPPTLPPGLHRLLATPNPQAAAQYPARQFTPLTNLSNESIPVEKNVLESLLKENQGLKMEANRNNIILDFLTNVIVKKQNLTSANSQYSLVNHFQPQVPPLPNPRMREEPRTADAALFPRQPSPMNGNHQPRSKQFRINTPVNQPGHNKPNRKPAAQKSEAPRKLNSSSPSHLKQLNPHPKLPPTIQTHQASSLLEEFQDIDNFQMIQPQNADYQHYNYEDQPFDEGIELRSPIEILENRRPTEVRGQSNRQFSSIGDVEVPSVESNYFSNMNKPNVTDLKLRSEKYKSELASKLARIKNDLNGKDSKIESLLNKIGGCS